MCRTKKGVPCVTFPAELQDGILPGGIDVPMLPGRATIGFKRGIFFGEAVHDGGREAVQGGGVWNM